MTSASISKELLCSGVSEAEFQLQVVKIARDLGWLCYHPYDSRRSAPGYPDLTMLRAGRLLFAELKSVKGRLRPEQVHWLEALKTCPGVEVFVWRPTDIDEIIEILGRT